MTRTHTTVHLALLVSIMMIGATTLAQDDPPDDAPPTDPPVVEDEPGDETAPPSLDDLLGIEQEEEDTTAAEIAQQQAEEELQRRLEEQAIHDGFREALEKMSLSADLLTEQLDCGLGTQRVQEEALARLDALIEQCRKAGGGSCSGGSQSTSQPQSKSGKPKPKQPGQKESPRSGSGGGAEPPLRQGDVNTIIDETRSEWGNLPQRVRDMLLQGRQEKFSSLYEQLTREYYRRLADESSS
jgi:hypothetical protein